MDACNTILDRRKRSPRSQNRLERAAAARRPRIVECLLTLRRIYESEREDPGRRRSPRQLAAGGPDLSGHRPLRLPPGVPTRLSTPYTDSPAINYQAVQQVPIPVHHVCSVSHTPHCTKVIPAAARLVEGACDGFLAACMVVSDVRVMMHVAPRSTTGATARAAGRAARPRRWA
jgi:hypothetical protein